MRGSPAGCAEDTLVAAGGVVQWLLPEYGEYGGSGGKIAPLPHRGNVLSPLRMIEIAVNGRLALSHEGEYLLLQLCGKNLADARLLAAVAVQHSGIHHKSQRLRRRLKVGQVALARQRAFGVVIPSHARIEHARLPLVQSLIVYRVEIAERLGGISAESLCDRSVILLLNSLLLGELELAQREHLRTDEAVGKAELGRTLGVYIIEDKALHRIITDALVAPPDSHRAVLLHNHEALGILVAAFRSRGVEFRPCGGGDGTVGFSEDQLVVKAGVCIGIEAQHIAEFPIIRIAHLDHVVPTGWVYDRVAFISVLRRRRRQRRNEAGAKRGAKSRTNQDQGQDSYFHFFTP